LTVEAKDIQLINGDAGVTGLFTQAGSSSTGNGGELNVKTNNLLVQDGAKIDANTFSSGKSGNLTVEAEDIQLIGESPNGISSGLFAQASRDSTGNAGNLTIISNNLLVKDGADIRNDTFASGNAGNLTIQTDNFTVESGSQIGVGTFANARGGNLTVEAKDILLTGRSTSGTKSGLFTEATSSSTGDGGDLNINTTTLQVEDGAIVSARSLSTGRAGNLDIDADSILLNNNASLNASTRSNKIDPQGREQATITINSKDLILRHSSNIFTEATGENVVGGSININSDVIAALENSDISADSDNFRGGNVNIITKGIFGTQFREQATDKSDITASGANSELSGSVEIDGLEQDPAETLTQLPSVPVSGEVYQACQPNDGNQSEFYFTGNGGLPPNPRDYLNSESVDVGWVSLPNQTGQVSGVEKENLQTPSKIQPPIVEATNLVANKNGDVFLVAQAPNGGNSGISSGFCLKK
ncbi:MAG: S-layer family protein, partial [Cyanobacteria bacterium P01_A01_bin.84]